MANVREQATLNTCQMDLGFSPTLVKREFDKLIEIITFQYFSIINTGVTKENIMA